MAIYPIPKYRFQVSWGEGDEGPSAGFKEVTGLQLTTEVIEYREGNMKEQYKVIQPGLQTFGEVTLKKGVFAKNSKMWEWWNQSNDGGSEFKSDPAEESGVARRTVQIDLINNQGEPAVKFTLNNAWATKIAVDDLKADTNEVTIQTLTLRHEGITMKWLET